MVGMQDPMITVLDSMLEEIVLVCIWWLLESEREGVDGFFGVDDQEED